MGARLPATTRANTSTSPQVAPARNNARAQALTVALEVSTSSMSSSLRPTTSGPAGRWHTKGALHVLGSLGLIEPDLLRRRLDPFESPMCDHSAARIGYDWASSADWLNRRAHWRRQCSGTGTSASASARSSQPARAIQAPWSAQGRADRRISSYGRAYERYRHNAPPRARDRTRAVGSSVISPCMAALR